jgi:hypothetical protein
LTAQFQFDPEWMLLAFVFVGLIFLGVFVIVRFKHWQAAQQPTTQATRIEDYRALMEQGLLDAREFERIRDGLEKKATPDSPRPSLPMDPTAIPSSEPTRSPDSPRKDPEA